MESKKHGSKSRKETKPSEGDSDAADTGGKRRRHGSSNAHADEATATTTGATSTHTGGKHRRSKYGRHRRRRRHRKTSSAAVDESSESVEDFNEAFQRQIEDLNLSDDEEEQDVKVTEEQVAKLEKQGFWFRKKKGLAGKLATGSAGTAFLRMKLDDEMLTLLDVSRVLVANFRDEAFSKLFHANLVRIATKTALLHDNRTLSDDDFATFRVPLRKVCSLVTINFAQGKWDAAVCDRVVELIKTMNAGICDMLRSHISKKSMDKLTMVTTFLEDRKYIEFAKSQTDEWEAIVEVFHHILEESRQ